MRVRISVIAAAALVLGCVSVDVTSTPSEPTASDIFDRYLEHRGGLEALDSLAAVEREGWISVDAGPAGLFAGLYHTCIRYPDRAAVEIDAGRFRIAQALRAEGAVECDANFTNCIPASEEIAAEMISTAATANKDLIEDAAAWRAAQVSVSDDGRAWRLTIENGERWAEFDRGDGHLRALGKGARWRRLGQWRDIGGVTLPHRLEDFAILENGESEWRNTVHLSEARALDAPSEWCRARFGSD